MRRRKTLFKSDERKTFCASFPFFMIDFLNELAQTFRESANPLEKRKVKTGYFFCLPSFFARKSSGNFRQRVNSIPPFSIDLRYNVRSYASSIESFCQVWPVTSSSKVISRGGRGDATCLVLFVSARRINLGRQEVAACLDERRENYAFILGPTFLLLLLLPCYCTGHLLYYVEAAHN